MWPFRKCARVVMLRRPNSSTDRRQRSGCDTNERIQSARPAPTTRSNSSSIFPTVKEGGQMPFNQS